MREISKCVAIGVLVTFVGHYVAFGVGSKRAAYFGGTVAVFGAAEDPIEGSLDTSDEDVLIFRPVKKDFAGKTLTIPYSQIIDIEYGQKAGRRVGAAAATTILLGPIGLVSLFSKKRKHFLTVGFKDDSEKDQVAVPELGKGIIRTTLAIVQTRSGKEIEYRDDEARKSSK